MAMALQAEASEEVGQRNGPRYKLRSSLDSSRVVPASRTVFTFFSFSERPVAHQYTIGHSHNIDEPSNSYFAAILAEKPSGSSQED